MLIQLQCSNTLCGHLGDNNWHHLAFAQHKQKLYTKSNIKPILYRKLEPISGISVIHYGTINMFHLHQVKTMLLASKTSSNFWTSLTSEKK